MNVVVVTPAKDARLEDLLKQPGRVIAFSTEQEVRTRPAPKGEVFVIDARGRQQLPAVVPMLKRERPESGFILVVSALDPPLMLEAMRAGVRECLPEPLSSADFDAAIARVATVGSDLGTVVAFVGAKGGVGTTTTAVNVALELSRIAPRKTLLIDLHLSNGDAGVFLGEEPRFSVTDALENAHRLDEALFRSMVVRTRSNLELLASPDSAIAATVDSGRIRSLLEFAGRRYTFTVVDVPRSEPAAIEALQHVAKIVIVANQELATVRSASRIAAVLRQRYGKERIALAVARYDPHAGIGQDDIERAVGIKVRHIIPSDYRRAVEALNTGRPLSFDNHNALSTSYRSLARDLAGPTFQTPHEEEKRGFLGMFSGRRN